MICFSEYALSDSNQTTLTVDVTGARTNQGQVIMSVFDSESTHLKVPKMSQVITLSNSGKARFIVTDLDFGRYSISVIHDENNNGELDTNFLGIPSEWVGSSNNVKSMFGPPSFEESAFELSAPKNITLKLRSVLD